MPSPGIVLVGEFVVAKIDPFYRDDLLYYARKGYYPDRFIKRASLEHSRAYGVATRNLATFLRSIFDPLASYSPDSALSASVVDRTGATRTTWLRGSRTTPSGYTAWFFNAGAGPYPPGTLNIGIYFLLGSGTTPPTINDYDLELAVQSISASGVDIVQTDSQSIISVSGSGTAESGFSCSEIGIIFKTVVGAEKYQSSPTHFESLLDRAVISAISFALGDLIAVQYKITTT